MTVKQLAEKLSLQALSLPEPDREITGGYAGDLLSWVMGRAQSGDAWLTIMTNLNIIAVASLADTACIIIAENSETTEELVQTAAQKGINLLKSEQPVFSLAAQISAFLALRKRRYDAEQHRRHGNAQRPEHRCADRS